MDDHNECVSPGHDAPADAPTGETVAPKNSAVSHYQQPGTNNNADDARAVARELHWFEKLNILGQLILVIVGIIAASIYGCQLHTMNGQLKEMGDSGKQTDRLLSLYQRQLEQITKQANDTHDLAIAVRDEATASQGIAGQAVTQATQTTRLANDTHSLASSAGTQATATQTLAINSQQSVATAKDAIYQEERPWVGIEIVRVDAAPNFIKTAPGIVATSFVIMAHNTGKTPAVGWRSECCENETRNWNEAVPNYDALRDDVDRHFSDSMRERIRTGTETNEQARTWVRKTLALEDNALFESKVIAPGGVKQVQNATETHANDHLFHYTLGKFVYRDVLDPSKTHVTQFCLVTLGNSGNLELCKTGNDMN